MGMDNLKHEQKGKSRGKVSVTRSLEGLGSGAGSFGPADYLEVNFDFVRGILVEITRRGGAVSFGLSRDRGAFNVTLFLDGTRKTVWISTSEDVDGKLEEILHFVASLPID